MSPMDAFVAQPDQFATYSAWVARCIRTDASFPERVFGADFSHFCFEEFDVVMSADGWPALQRLAQQSGDDEVLIAVIEPDPEEYYKRQFGYYNWARLRASATSQQYWEILSHGPSHSPADSILLGSEKIVWTTRSGLWAVYGERDLEICVLDSVAPVPAEWHDLNWALSIIASGPLRGSGLPSALEAGFRREYGEGP